MKKNIVYNLIFMMMMLFVSSCSSDDDLDEPVVIPEEKARYYVKYEVNSNSGTRYTGYQSITFTTENGSKNHSNEFKASSSLKWEATYGPFNKGDEVKLSVTNTVMNIHGRIYISREKEPFVIKAEGEGNKSLDLQATIDF